MYTPKQWARTALIRAANAGRADCVRLLLENGSDKEAKDKVRVRARENHTHASYRSRYIYRHVFKMSRTS